MVGYPIVYIRGYAMTSSEVEDTFNMPYYGFNLGATQIRVAKDQKPVMRIFESPVVRLIKEESYFDSFNRFVDTSNRPMPNSVPGAGVDWRRTLWIFRFYDVESQLLGGRERGGIEDYAEALALFLNDVRQACGTPDGFKVNLIAHSMGGLIARCFLQNMGLFQRPALANIQPVVVNKFFTYGTPHGGITFRRGLGWVEDVRDLFGVRGSDTFGEQRMREFLSLREEDDLRTYRPVRADDPPLERVFCIVGTNYQDYVVWVSKNAVGPGSDGLVALENAYVKGAARAYIHRAHSGPFGMVNSEEGYQNLTRFLFGDVRYEMILEPLGVVQDLPGLGEGDELDYLLIDVDVVIRGLPAYIQTRREEDQSAVIVKMAPKPEGVGYVQEELKPTHLFTGYLRLKKKMKEDPFMRGAIQLRIEPHYRHRGWIRESRFEGEAILNDRLHLGVRADVDPPLIEYRWASESETAAPMAPQPDGSYLFPLPGASRRYLSGDGIRVRTSPWE